MLEAGRGWKLNGPLLAAPGLPLSPWSVPAALLRRPAIMAGLAALPLYMQIVKGVSPTQAGLLLLPLTAGIMAASIVSGQFISRTSRYRMFPIMGAGLLVASMLGVL